MNVRTLSSILLCSVLGAFGVNAQACKLAREAYDLDAFLASKKPNQVVFRGRVKAVESITTADGELKHQIDFEVNRWWRGSVRMKVAALGFSGTMKGTSCEGSFDFAARVGEEWLVVGVEENNFVRPSGLLSKVVVNGAIPTDILRRLQSL